MDFKQLTIEGDPTQYKLYSNKTDYYLWIPTNRFLNQRCLHIKANDDEVFKTKLEMLLNNPVARAKLDFKITSIPIGLRNIIVPGMPKHEIFLDEEKLTGSFSNNAYNTIGIDGDLEQFDSQLGTIDRKQINYFSPLASFEGYSGRLDKQVKIRDDVWTKSHEAAQYVNTSNDCRELLETIIAQTYSGQKIDPKFTAEMCVRLREDFIHNIHGYDTFNIHTKGQTLLPYQEVLSRFEWNNDPLRGGRFWESHAPSNQEIALLMYIPQIDGTAKLRYDSDNQNDKKTFNKIVDILKIKPKDCQYTMNYARKALGIKIAMKYLQEELASIKIDDPVLSPQEITYNKKKWQDLTRIKDELFKNSGDLRDSLRKGNVGFSAYVEAVGLSNIPPLKQKQNRETEGLPDHKGFSETAAEGIGKVTENYPYFENLFGWQGREYISTALKQALSNDIFQRKVPSIVAENAVVMLLETMDRTGRRLKLFNDVYDKDASLSALSKKLVDRIGRGDFSNVGDIIKRQNKRIKQLFEGKQDSSDTGVKRLALQGEGVMFEEEVFSNYAADYMGDNNGILYSTDALNNNSLAGSEGFMSHFYWQEADKMIAKIIPTAVDLARFMRVHQARLLHNSQEKLASTKLTNRQEILDRVYSAPEMITLDIYLKKAASKMALEYFMKNKHSLNDGADEDLRILFKQVKMEYVNLLQMLANVVAMVAYNPEKRLLT
jgi:hypothetical protein